jgi:hypothetical protein
MSEKKQTSSKILMGLIVLMYALQTIHSACNWYITWLGFIYYGNTPDQAFDALEQDGSTSLSLLVIGSMFELLVTLRLGIADSIMVSIDPSLPTSTINSFQLEGLEVLDYMQQKLDGSNCPSGLQSWVYRYVMALRTTQADKQFQLLG